MDRSDYNGLMGEWSSAELPPGQPVLVGLSGGKDSTGLAVWASRTYPEIDWHLVHIRHGLRDDEPDATAARQAARILNRPFIEEPAHWHAVTKPNGPEDGARQARYAAFQAVGKRLGANHIALAHTADDQAETLLLRLVRGTGITGLAGMAPIRVHNGLVVHRPLLSWRRADVRTLASGFPTVEDPTNNDLTQRRAYARHEVIPKLGNLRPDQHDPVPALVSLSQHANNQMALLDELIAPLIGPSWGPIQRINEGLSPRITAHLIYRALTPHVTTQLVHAIYGLQKGERLDISGDRWASRDQFGWVISPYSIDWSIRLTEQPPSPPPGIHSQIDPLQSHPLPWIIPIFKDIKIEDCSIRVRESGDSIDKALVNRFPKSLRKQLPVVYTKEHKVLAVGPIAIPANRPFEVETQWIAVSPRAHQIFPKERKPNVLCNQ